jgi:hypothetical protein
MQCLNRRFGSTPLNLCNLWISNPRHLGLMQPVFECREKGIS